MSIAPRRPQNKRCFVYCGRDKCTCYLSGGNLIDLGKKDFSRVDEKTVDTTKLVKAKPEAA